MVIGENTTAEKEEKKNIDCNNYAYEKLLLSIQTTTDEGK